MLTPCAQRPKIRHPTSPLPTMKLPAWIDRVRQNVAVKLFLDSASRWSTHRASSKGAALALYMVFSLAPILMLVIAVAGFFFGDEAVRSQLVLEMRSLTGQQGAEVIQTVLASAQQSDNGLLAALISAGLLIFSATTAFNELKESLDELWDVEPGKKAGAWALVRTRVLSFGLILVLALFLLMSLW
jgi:membrane protein